MIIDGNKINKEIQDELRDKAKGLSLAIIWVGDSPVSAKYIEKKKQFGEEIEARVDVFKYGAGILTSELKDELRNIIRDNYTGIIVQLPLPKQIDAPTVLDMIPIDKDVDLLSEAAYKNFVEGRSKVLPPVVGSVKEILGRGSVGDLHGMNAVVIGRGKLVGKPVASWLASQGAKVDWLGIETADLSPFTKKADIIVTGAGVPNLITSDMIRDCAIVIDASTVDLSGKLVGDVDPAMASKCKIFSPVPGGVGPITVAMLFRNLQVLGGLSERK